ncbi:hypothetical protein M8494_25920 [Serratia ureilytica]
MKRASATCAPPGAGRSAVPQCAKRLQPQPERGRQGLGFEVRAGRAAPGARHRLQQVQAAKGRLGRKASTATASSCGATIRGGAAGGGRKNLADPGAQSDDLRGETPVDGGGEIQSKWSELLNAGSPLVT